MKINCFAVTMEWVNCIELVFKSLHEWFFILGCIRRIYANFGGHRHSGTQKVKPVPGEHFSNKL